MFPAWICSLNQSLSSLGSLTPTPKARDRELGAVLSISRRLRRIARQPAPQAPLSFHSWVVVERAHRGQLAEPAVRSRSFRARFMFVALWSLVIFMLAMAG